MDNEKKRNAFKMLEEKLNEYSDGYFELYKNISADNKSEKRYVIHKHMFVQSNTKDLNNYSNPSEIYFGIFLCLMMRYTQNERITGISLNALRDYSYVHVLEITNNNTLTFKNVIDSISKDKWFARFESQRLNTVLQTLKKISNCLFICTDSEELDADIFRDSMLPDICFHIIVNAEKNILNIVYNETLYDKNRVSFMAQHYDNLLSCALHDPAMLIYKANYLSVLEEKKLVDVWNQTDYPFPSEYCIHQLFEKRVKEDPNAIAVYYEGKTMSRRLLNELSNQLAHMLIQLGVKTGDIIALYSNKSIDFVIGIIGILKAGGAYLPIDASYPQSRVEYILENSKASFAVTTTELNVSLEIVSELTIVKLDKRKSSLMNFPVENPEVSVDPYNPCYLIYTSGSTGRPKGVLLNHRGRVNNFYDFNSRFHINSNDRVLAVSSVSFDMSAYDILGSMIAGSSVVLPNPLLEKQPFHWLELIEKYNVTIWHSVPILLELLYKCYQHRKKFSINSIRLVLMGGDWIPLPLLEEFRLINNEAKLISLGGATEVSMDSTIYQIRNIDKNWKSIPYGKPMRNQKAYVLDKNRQLMPIGFPGELYLGGIGVADGYYLNPEETKKRFFINPWSNDSTQRIYKTGDLAYYGQDGNLILLGRCDFQIKINGTRIELGEIEHCLLKFKNVNRAVAVAPKIGTNRKIIAYVEYRAKSNIPKENEIIRYISRFLPKSHIPARVIISDSIPITPNGKIDRKNLEMSAEKYLKI